MFRYESKFGTIMTQVFDLIMLNLIFVILSLPIITIGANLTAMYAVTMQLSQKNAIPVYKRFFQKFRENLKESTIWWLFLVVIAAVLLLDLELITGIPSLQKFLVPSIYFFIGLLVVYLTFLFPLIGKFQNSFKERLQNTFLIAIGYFPFTILLVLLSYGPMLAAVLWIPGIYGILLYYYLFIGCSLTCYINSFLFNRIFRKLLLVKETELNTSFFE